MCSAGTRTFSWRRSMLHRSQYSSRVGCASQSKNQGAMPSLRSSSYRLRGRVGRAEGREELRLELAEFPPARGVLGQHHRPGLGERQVEGARAVRPAVVVFGGRRPGHEARQVRRGGDRREQLGRADVGDPVHAHPPVRLREPRGPLDRVVAVLGLVRERVPLPLAAPPAADVLDRDDVPAPGVPQRVRVNGVLRLGLAVRGPHEQHRKGPGALRSIDVRK